jgi:uncharacterized protein (TIGR02271 family)
METRGVREGMTVRSADGEKLGKVVQCAEQYFLVEKGFFFPKDYLARYSQVLDIRDDEIHLRETAASLGEASASLTESSEEGRAGLIGGADPGIGSDLGPERAVSGQVRDADEIRVPLAEEELQAEKRTREAGAVRVRKEVNTEHKQISVPVTREEVHVERVPASESTPGSASFQEGTVSMPLHEEEVEITKKPRVREEVRVSRTKTETEQRADAEVRREDARIEREGDIHEPRDKGHGEPPTE